jgi:hypothetical protein
MLSSCRRSGHGRESTPECLLRQILLFLLPVFVCCPGAAGAAHWETSGSIALEARQSNNYRLTTNNQLNVWGVTLTPRLDIIRRTERGYVDGSARVRASRYPDVKGLDSNDAFVNLDLQHSAERLTAGLAAGFAHDSTTYSELGDTGILQANRRRNSGSAAPRMSYALSERAAVDLNLNYRNVNYDDGVAVGLYDYDYESVSTAYRINQTEKNYWFVSASASRYDSQQSGTTFDDIGLQVGALHQISVNASWRISLGVRRTDSEVRFNIPGVGPVTVEDRARGGTLDGYYAYQWQRSTLKLSAGRQFEPSGSGYVVLRDRIGLGLSRKATETATMTLRVDALRTTSLRDDITGIDRKYYSIEPRLNWRLDRAVTTSLGYRYRYQKYRHQSDSADDHSVDFRLQYSFR